MLRKQFFAKRLVCLPWLVSLQKASVDVGIPMFSFGGPTGKVVKLLDFLRKSHEPRRFGSERLWTNRAERLPWVPRPASWGGKCWNSSLFVGLWCHQKKVFGWPKPCILQESFIWVRVFSGSLCHSRSVTWDLIHSQIEGSQGLFLRRRALDPMIQVLEGYLSNLCRLFNLKRWTYIRVECMILGNIYIHIRIIYIILDLPFYQDKNEVGFYLFQIYSKCLSSGKPNEKLKLEKSWKIDSFETSSHPTPPRPHAPNVFLRIARAGRLMGILGPSGAGRWEGNPQGKVHWKNGDQPWPTNVSRL